MSFEEQLKRHQDALPPEPSLPACLDTSLRVQEWAQYYPTVDTPPNFFDISPSEAHQHHANNSHALVASVLQEHSKSAEFRESKMCELEERLEDCQRRMLEVNIAGSNNPQNALGAAETVDDSVARDLHSILEDVEQVNLELCLLEKFTATCRDSFDLHIHRIAPQALAPYLDSVNAVAARVRSDRPRVGRFIEGLSRIYDDLRSGGSREKKEAKVGTSFVRKSIKYWVHPDNLTEVKCHVLRHLPLFAFPNKDGSPHNPAITSVYYDNDTLDLYTGRLLKQDEAIALRIRWYGVPSQPVVYIENKIHYEDWTGEPSTKSRFGLEESRVNAYMAGSYTLDARIKELLDQGKVPEKEIHAMDKLAKAVQKAVKDRELKPMMRTFYNRTAFQLPDSARVRLSLDEDLTFIREDAQVVGRRLADGSIDTNWRRRDVGIEWPFERVPENEIHHFPYAIMEVKLQTESGKEPPLWARELMQSQLVEESPKFSKFVHGCVSLLEPLAPLYPYWLQQMHTDIRHHRQYTILELTRTTVNVPWAIPPGPTSLEPKPAFIRNSVASSTSGYSMDAPSASIGARTALSRHSMMPAGAETMSFENGANNGGGGGANRNSNSRNSAVGSTMDNLKNRMSAASSTLTGPKNATTANANNNKLAPSGLPLSYLPPKTRKLMVPTVVEPKIHFANERTFLGWTHYALFLINGATAIINFTNGTGRLALRFAGIGISIGGILFLLVGLWVREARQKKITYNPEQERLDSTLPLFIIVGTVTFAVAANWFSVFAS